MFLHRRDLRIVANAVVLQLAVPIKRVLASFHAQRPDLQMLYSLGISRPRLFPSQLVPRTFVLGLFLRTFILEVFPEEAFLIAFRAMDLDPRRVSHLGLFRFAFSFPRASSWEHWFLREPFIETFVHFRPFS